MRYTLIALLTFSVAGIANAQEAQCPANLQASDSARTPDLVIRASASAESIRFETQPKVEVRLSGCAALDTVRVLERRNLPDPVQPGATYRDVYIATEILGYLNVDCLLEGLVGVGNQPAAAGGAQPAEGAAAGSAAAGRIAAQAQDCGTSAGVGAPDVPSATPAQPPAATPSPAQPPAPESPQGQAVPAGSGPIGSAQGLTPNLLTIRPHLELPGGKHTPGNHLRIDQARA